MLTRPYQHLTAKALIEPHHITCVSLNISILIVRFGDQARACRVDIPTSHQKQIRRTSTKVSWLFMDYPVAVNKQISEVILTPGNNAILVAYQINAH